MKKTKKLISAILLGMLSVSFIGGCSSGKSNSKTITVFNCGDYIDEDLIDKFEEETGYTVNYSTYDTNETMYSKLKSGANKYDLVFPSDYMIEKMIEEGMAEKINFDNKLFENIIKNNLNQNGKLLIAHSDSREFLNNLHKDTDERVSEDRLIEINKQKELFEEANIRVTKAYEDDEIYYLVIENL